MILYFPLKVQIAYNESLMKRKKFFLLGSGILFVFLQVSCGPRPTIEIADTVGKPRPEVLAILRANGILLYPKAFFLKDTLTFSKVGEPLEVPPTNKEHVVTIASIWLAVPDEISKIRSFYEATHPYVFSEEKYRGETAFLQLSNVPDLKQALTANVSPISLIEIRRQKLSETQKAAYQRELKRLKGRTEKDLASQRRISQIKRILKETPLIKLSIRTLSEVDS